MPVIEKPKNYETFQRIGGISDIPVTGTYAGTPTAIEARYAGGTWAVIDTSPSGGTFSGTLVGQPQSQLAALEVRGVGADTIPVSVEVGIGDIYHVIGQSNALGRALNPQPVGGLKPGIRISTVDMYDNWSLWVDQLSYWGEVAQYIIEDQNCAVCIVQSSAGGTNIDYHLATAGSNSPWNYAKLAARWTPRIKAWLFWQGEANSYTGMSTGYWEKLQQSIADYRSLCETKGYMIAQNASSPSSHDPADLRVVRQAHRDSWTLPGVHQGPSPYDVATTADNGDIHFSTDEEMSILAYRWWQHIKRAFYGGTASSPEFQKAEAAGRKINVTFNLIGAAGFVNPDTTGWEIKDSAGTVTVTSASASGSVVTLDIGRDISGSCTISRGAGMSGRGATLRDNNDLPPLVFWDEPVSTTTYETLDGWTLSDVSLQPGFVIM